jgi:hypothetical protein
MSLTSFVKGHPPKEPMAFYFCKKLISLSDIGIKSGKIGVKVFESILVRERF